MPNLVSLLARKFAAGFLIAAGICAARAATTAAPYSIDTWGAEEGLPQSSVIALTQTRDGYLWLGTLNGLVRFDGIRFAVFDESNTPGLSSSRIVHLFEDSEKNLWIGTETAGAAVLKNGRVTSLDIGRGRRDGRLVASCEDSTGAVWLYTADGELARYFNGKVQVWKTVPSRSRTLIAEKPGQVLVGTDYSMFAIDPTAAFETTSLPPGQMANVGKLDFLLASQTGGHWRLANGVIEKFISNRSEKKLGAYPWSAGAIVTAACEDRKGNLIVGTLGQGLFWFDGEGHATHISKAEGLSNNSILSLSFDREENLWVGTDGGGLNRVKRQIFQRLDESSGLTVQSICEDPNSGLWFSSNDRGVSFWRNGSLSNVGLQQGSMRSFNVRAMLVDRNQQIWAATFGAGLFQLAGGTFRRAPGTEGIPSEISALHQDRKGQLWIGTQRGLARWDGKELRIFTEQDGLSANIVRAIADDAEGNLWIGTEHGGLNRLRDEKFTSCRQADGFPSDNISSLYVDADGVLWIGTFGNGLVRFHDGKWIHYSSANGLVSNSVDYLIEDDQGFLWIGSNFGLTRVQKKALNDFAAGSLNFVPCRGYGKRDGLPTSECTLGSQPAACRTRDGKIWFPTIAGIAAVDPAQFHSNTNPPPVVIESVRVEAEAEQSNGLRAKLPEIITIPAGKERLEIHFTSLNLAAPQRARFKYRLAGHEKDWIDVGNTRIARYSKLPPGEYRFEVTACNEDGAWNQTGASLAVTVLPPFWKTWWFLTATAVALLGIVVAVVHFVSTQRLQRQLEGLRQQQALEKDRARIARDIHDQVGASLTQLSLLGEMVEGDKDVPEEIENHARQISQTARETTRALDEIVWTVNPSNDTLDGLINYICKHAQEFLAVAGVRYRLDVPADLPSTAISPEARHNIFLAAKEAVTNVVRHANASEVSLRLRLEPEKFILEIEDNGRGPGGANEKAAQSRNGLSNMRKRMEDVGGKFSIGPGTNGGTLVRLSAPIAKN